MDLSELSYGNYIRKKDDKTIWKVIGINNTGELKCHNGEVVEQHQITEYEGVFVLPDILDMCGWKGNEMYMTIPIETRSGFYAQYYFGDRVIGLYRVKHGAVKDFYCISAPGLNYVHELQNFLKLAIPEKEFIKFKNF